MKFDIVLDTKNKHKGVNKMLYIVEHGTAGGTFESNCKTLTTGSVSCHYLVGFEGQIAKIGKHSDILWHAGVGVCPNGDKNPNGCCIGIEVLSDSTGKGFTEKQKAKVKELTEFIMGKEGILAENVIRHADLTKRKPDIDLSFFAPFTMKEWRKTLKPKKYLAPEQEEIIQDAITANSKAWEYCDDKTKESLHNTNELLKTLL